MIFIKRKNILILSLVALLVITGYINCRYNKQLQDQQALSELKSDEISDQENEYEEQADNASKINILEDNYDNQLESETSSSQASIDFFVEYRLERDKTRSEEVELLKEIVEDKSSSQEKINEAQEKIMNIVERTEQEIIVENLLKAQGFNEAVAMINEDSINIIVDKQDLTEQEVAQIQNIVLNETDFEIPQIKIIEKR